MIILIIIITFVMLVFVFHLLAFKESNGLVMYDLEVAAC